MTKKNEGIIQTDPVDLFRQLEAANAQIEELGEALDGALREIECLEVPPAGYTLTIDGEAINRRMSFSEAIFWQETLNGQFARYPERVEVAVVTA